MEQKRGTGSTHLWIPNQSDSAVEPQRTQSEKPTCGKFTLGLRLRNFDQSSLAGSRKKLATQFLASWLLNEERHGFILPGSVLKPKRRASPARPRTSLSL